MRLRRVMWAWEYTTNRLQGGPMSKYIHMISWITVKISDEIQTKYLFSFKADTLPRMASRSSHALIKTVFRVFNTLIIFWALSLDFKKKGREILYKGSHLNFMKFLGNRKNIQNPCIWRVLKTSELSFCENFNAIVETFFSRKRILSSGTNEIFSERYTFCFVSSWNLK